MLQEAIFLLAGVVYFIATSLAHRRRVLRWRNTVDYAHPGQASRPPDISSKELI